MFAGIISIFIEKKRPTAFASLVRDLTGLN